MKAQQHFELLKSLKKVRNELCKKDLLYLLFRLHVVYQLLRR